MAQTVKTREHHGADSFDLTVPVDVVREHEINKGDIFEVKAEVDDGDVVLTYRRVYES